MPLSTFGLNFSLSELAPAFASAKLNFTQNEPISSNLRLSSFNCKRNPKLRTGVKNCYK
jgi:hypothetical protein